jgi:hypothetical protein
MASRTRGPLILIKGSIEAQSLVKQLLIAASLIDAELGKFRQNSPPSPGR